MNKLLFSLKKKITSAHNFYLENILDTAICFKVECKIPIFVFCIVNEVLIKCHAIQMTYLLKHFNTIFHSGFHPESCLNECFITPNFGGKGGGGHK